MPNSEFPIAIIARDAAPQTKPSNYPEPFASRMVGRGETPLHPGMCAGFKAGTGNGHQLVNRTNEEVLYLEVGDRTPGDSVSYPADDLKAVLGSDGKWQFVHKDGTAY